MINAAKAPWVAAPAATIPVAPAGGPGGAAPPAAAAARDALRGQFPRNVYEATYALEALAWDVDRRWRAFHGPADRRRWILDVLERACVADPCRTLERDGGRVVLAVEPAVDADACGVQIELATEVGT